MVGESPYLAGAVPCSWCPDDKPFCQNNLCGELDHNSPALESATLSCCYFGDANSMAYIPSVHIIIIASLW